jgi:DNA-binding beta-propeller fold protein YncE
MNTESGKTIMQNRKQGFFHILTAIFFLMLTVAPVGAVDLYVTYLYKLANFDGIIPFNGPQVFTDDPQGEVFVMSSEVHIFSSTGMETFQIDYNPAVGSPADAAVDSDGNIIILASKALGYQIVRCNFRGEVLSRITLRNVPPEFNSGYFGRMVLYKDRLYLLDGVGRKVVVVDMTGNYIRGYDIDALLGGSDKEKEDQNIGGFNLDRQGNILFTLPVHGLACRMTPDGEIVRFGRRGSGPGKFGVPAGIASDTMGNYLVTDKLRSFVLVFDKDLKFVKEFGGRGWRPHNLIVPGAITVDSGNRVYVSQLRRRGVNVYQLTYGN